MAQKVDRTTSHGSYGTCIKQVGHEILHVLEDTSTFSQLKYKCLWPEIPLLLKEIRNNI